MYNKKNSL